MNRLFYILLCVLALTTVNAQIGFKKDSLQIKVYADIYYENNNAKEIKITKVFCDYCTEYQSKIIAEDAKRRAYIARNDEENRMDNGKKRLALYIRISKKDFAALKEEDNNTPKNE